MSEVEQVVESTESDVASPEAASSAPEQSAASDSAQAEPKQDSTNIPFHEHPRFKELIEQKNQAQEAQKAYEQRIAQMEARMQELSQPKNPAVSERQELLKRLEGIDPAFAALISELAPATKELQDLKAWKEQMDTQQIRTQAVSTVNTLHDQNKVSGELKELINEQLQAMDARGLIRNVQDVPRAYKEVHDKLSKYVESIKRGVTASYTTDKTSAARVPTSQPKGAPVKTAGNKMQFNTRDREAGLAQVVSQYIKSKNGSNDL